MRRTIAIAAALTVIATAYAWGAETSHAAKAHRRHAGAGASQAAHRPAPSHGVLRAERTRPRTRTSSAARATAAKASVERKRSPQEVGRAAGLAIRRELLRREAERALVRLERARESRRPKLERANLRSARARSQSSSADAGAERSTPNTNGDDDQTMAPRPSAGFVSAKPDEKPLSGDAPDAGRVSNADDRVTARPAAERVTQEGADDATREGRGTADRHEAQAEGTPEAERSEKADEESEEASLYVPRGGMPAPLRGSLASLQRQNSRLDAEGLERIQDEADLRSRIAHKLLIPVPVSSALTVNEDLSETHRYCRPWTARFLADLARAHKVLFHKPLEVSSAVRTVEYQKQLMETNANAAEAEGDIVSPHLTGATVDITKSGMSRMEIAWMRRRLASLQAAGKIDVEEEFRQACFHITVYKTYAPSRKASPAAPGKHGGTRGRHSTPETTAAIDDQGT